MRHAFAAIVPITLIAGCGGAPHSAPVEPAPAVAPPSAEPSAPPTAIPTVELPPDDYPYASNGHHGRSLRVTDTSIGPFDADTELYPDDLRGLFPSGYRLLEGSGDPYDPDGFRVEVGTGTQDSLIALFTRPDDPSHLRAIRINSVRLDVPMHSWHTSEPLADLEGASRCQCWQASVSCYQPGTHWVVTVRQGCSFDGTQEVGAEIAAADLVGKEIEYVTWTVEAMP